MNLFARIFDDSDLDQGQKVTSERIQFNEDAATAIYPEEVAPSSFASYVNSVIVTGAPPVEDTPESQQEAEDNYVVEDDYTSDDALDDDLDLENDQLEEEDEEEEEPYVEDRAFEADEPVHSPITEVPSSQRITSPHVEEIVNGLFDKLQGPLGGVLPRLEDKQRNLPAPRKANKGTQRNALATTKREMTQMIRSEMPRALKGEFLTVLRAEITRAVKGELSSVIRDEFKGLTGQLRQVMERLHAVEARMAKIEGAVGQELKLNFPEGMVQIDAPITIPEREVKIAAPVNVQPPSVTFDEGAISVSFNKAPGGKKTVKFDRDPFDNCVKSAEIVDVPAE
jgi:hypothetical protein